MAEKKFIKIIKVKERRYNEDVLTVKEMMDMLAIGKNTAYKLLHDGTIESFRIGTIYKVLRKSVEEYIYKKRK
jgi:excisionase family DNA binding protein